MNGWEGAGEKYEKGIIPLEPFASSVFRVSRYQSD